MNLIKIFFSKIGLDAAIAITILTRVIQAASGIVSILFIARFLSASEQGYYYTFGSIIAIQIFFELGLSGIITQYVAHEFANLSWDNNGRLQGEDYYKSRLSSLLHFSIKWFGIISIGLFFILVAVGFYFFSTYNNNNDIEWQTPWVILCLTTSLNLFIDPILAYFDGLGEVKDMAKVRLIQKSVNVILLFLLFAFGFKLYSAAIASLAAILVNYGQIFLSKRFLVIRKIWVEKSEWSVNYVKEILPFQVKIALSWISGYFIFQLFSPVLFVTKGPVIAGQMGMTLQALNGISGISMSWIITKVPLFSQYIARKEFDQLDTLFNKTLKNMLVVNFVLLFVFTFAVFIFNSFNLVYADRFLPLLPILILSIACFVNQIIFSWATYLRCHKSEPFLLQSIVFAVLVTASTYILGHKFGVMGIVGGYGTLVLFVSLLWSYLIFVNKKLEWHV